LEQIKHKAPDVILLDLGLPDMNGLEVASLVRRSEKTSRIPILAMSGSPMDYKKCLEVGCNDFIHKPFSISTLLVRLTALIPGRSRSLTQDNRFKFAMLGTIVLLLGLTMYLSTIVLSLVWLAFFRTSEATELIAGVLWYSGLPTSLGIVLIVLDVFFLLPRKRLHQRCIENCPPSPQRVAVALMSYNVHEMRVEFKIVFIHDEENIFLT
jgi:CheY-like chemotaxis protein